MPADDLRQIFGGAEPLADHSLADRFRALLGTSAASKPFECVGDVDECRAAAVLAAAAAGPGGHRAPAGAGRRVPPARPAHHRSAAPPGRRALDPGCVCGRRSPGLTCAAPASGCGAWASRGRRTCASWPRSARNRCWWTTGRRPRAPAGRPVLATGDGGLDALAACDVVVKSPGISRYRPEVAELAGRGIPVAGGLGLWLAEADRDRVICITGTKGKSTTTAIAGHLLTRLGLPLPGGREHRPAAVGPGGAGARLRLLGDRDIQLPGDRPALLAAGGRGDLAAPGPPGLARRRGDATTGTSCRPAPSPGPT